MNGIKINHEELDFIQMLKDGNLRETADIHAVMRFYFNQKCNLHLSPCYKCTRLDCETCKQ